MSTAYWMNGWAALLVSVFCAAPPVFESHSVVDIFEHFLFQWLMSAHRMASPGTNVPSLKHFIEFNASIRLPE